jgi:hypothetical protein
MERKSITRIGGATIFGALGLVWGWLAQGDAIVGVFTMLSSQQAQDFLAFVGDWGWLALLAFAVAVLIWGDPLHWPASMRRRPSRQFISLADAATYIGTRSAWARDCPKKTEEWNRLLPRLIADAGGLGRLRATGRRPRPNHNRYDIISASSRVPIEPSFWENAWFQAIPNVVPHSSDTQNVIYDQRQGSEPMFLDVEINAKDLRREWPPLPFWDKFESPILLVREGRSEE